jgi:HPt (histidine-containing phosphotransfer) domain-containing protein
MPELDGFAATTEIRRLEKATGYRVPIVALTANALDGDREVCIAAGMDDYLAKPFSREQLTAVLKRWIAGSGTAPAGSAPDASRAQPQPPLPKPSAEIAAGEPLNPRALDALRAMMGANGEAFACKVIRTYLEDMPAGIVRMQAAAAARDADALQKAAHSMKSSSANVGAERLARLCRDLEMIGRSGTTDGASSLLEDAVGEFSRVATALGAQLARRPPIPPA